MFVILLYAIYGANRPSPVHFFQCYFTDFQRDCSLHYHVGETPLHQACIKNNAEKVLELLASPDIDLNAQDNAGWTPLHEACNHGNLECVQELLKFAPGGLNESGNPSPILS